VKQDSTVIDTRTYDDGGRMLTSTYDNGVTDTRTYNTDNTLAEIDFGGTGSAIGDLTYGWDSNKNKTSETIAGVMSGYSFTVPTSSYDDEDRLVDFDGAADQVDQSWNLSLVGDWDSVTTDSTTQNRTHGPTHELLTAGGSSVTHDAKGNMISIPANLRDSSDPLSLNWDFDNRMKSADTDNDSTADVFYEFDALGRRVARDDGTQDTIFVQVGQQTIADYVSGTAAASPEYIYAWGSYIDELILRTEPSGTDLHYHRNQQYSTYAVTNSSGGILERYAFSPYGELTITDASGTTRSASTMDTRYTYTGREWDDKLVLYHFRARMYDAICGRFLQRDPLEELVTDNRYQIFACSPLCHVDPSGLIEVPLASDGKVMTVEHLGGFKWRHTICFMTQVQHRCRCGMTTQSTSITFTSALNIGVSTAAITKSIQVAFGKSYGAEVGYQTTCNLPGTGSGERITEFQACLSWTVTKTITSLPRIICIWDSSSGKTICFPVWPGSASTGIGDRKLWFNEVLISDDSSCSTSPGDGNDEGC
jgi:RHS repeat-associated protein